MWSWLYDQTFWTAFGAVCGGGGAVATAISVLYIKRALDLDHMWHRDNATREILFELYVGYIQEDLYILSSRHEVDILKNSDMGWRAVREQVSPDLREDFDYRIGRIVVAFELLSQLEQKSVLDSDVCYGFLGVIPVKLFDFSIELIKERRFSLGDERAANAFERLAEKCRGLHDRT